MHCWLPCLFSKHPRSMIMIHIGQEYEAIYLDKICCPKIRKAGRLYYINGSIMKIIFVSILVALYLSEIVISAYGNLRLTSSDFDSRGTITKVLSPSSLLINDKEVKLEGVDPSGLYSSLMHTLWKI